MCKIGAANILITNPRDIAGFVKDLSRQRFTALVGVNTLFNMLLHNPDFTRLDFKPLNPHGGGGMAVQRAIAEQWQAVTGNSLIEAYGLTEASPGVTANPLDLAEFSGAIGLPLPNRPTSPFATMTTATCRSARRASFVRAARRS